MSAGSGARLVVWYLPWVIRAGNGGPTEEVRVAGHKLFCISRRAAG